MKRGDRWHPPTIGTRRAGRGNTPRLVLADQYGVDRTTIRNIQNGKSWGWVK